MGSSNCSEGLTQLLADLKLLQTRLVMRNRVPMLIPPPEADSALLGQLGALKPTLAELRPEIVEMLTQSCPVCERDVTDAEDRERLADPLYCQVFGSKTEVRCPYKKGPWEQW
jgi:hypothetical protein